MLHSVKQFFGKAARLPGLIARGGRGSSSAASIRCRILFVCMGNICRSPLAEGAARMFVERNGLVDLVEVDSAGTGNWHEGEAPDPRAQKIARERGVDISRQRARQIRPGDFERFDYVLAMDESNLESLQRLCPDGQQGRLGLLMAHARVFEEREVPDPYYGGEAGFERVWNMVDDAVAGFFAKLDLSELPHDPDRR